VSKKHHFDPGEKFNWALVKKAGGAGHYDHWKKDDPSTSPGLWTDDDKKPAKEKKPAPSGGGKGCDPGNCP